MPLLILVLPLVLVLVVLVLMPLSLLQRYRMGTARRQARGWVSTVNVVAMALSVAFYMTVAALTSVFVVNAFTYALLGLLGGGALGLLGLWLSRWDAGHGSLHYTPNRWLVLGVTLVVTARIAYGVGRAWHNWHGSSEGASWLTGAGLEGSLAAGAVVLGYHLMYWAGVRRRVHRHRRSTAC